jgi:hypothetical protein
MTKSTTVLTIFLIGALLGVFCAGEKRSLKVKSTKGLKKVKRTKGLKDKTKSTKTPKGGAKGGVCGPCDTSAECWLELPEAAGDFSTPSAGFTPIARADVILKDGGPPSHQIYRCMMVDTDTFAWKLSDVEAFLSDQNGEPVGLHFFDTDGAPRWQIGESLITGSLIEKIPSPDGSENIAWLWVQVTENNEFGVLGKYEAVRVSRYCTKGGVPPSTGCSVAADEGTEAKSAYETSYFYFSV